MTTPEKVSPGTSPSSTGGPAIRRGASPARKAATESRQARARRLKCGHLGLTEVDALYAVFRAAELRGVTMYCENCYSWIPFETVVSPVYSQEAMF